MNRDTIFTVKNEHLNLLDENTAVDFFQQLLWAEARRIGIPISKINVSSRINVPDGGIDATVDDDQIETGCGIIKPGKTSYQIKAGKASKPWWESVIKKELLNKQNLKEGIQACLNACGTYVLVCTGFDLVDCDYRKALNYIKKHLECCGYSNPKVEVWGQNTLRGFLKMYPSLALWVTGRSSAKFQTHGSWALNANMQVPFVPGQSQTALIEKIQNDLRCEDNTAPVLVSGLPGIGKTRLVLEATRTEDLSPLVIYCPADQFLQDKFLMDELCNDDNPFCAVVVIDDSNLHSRSEVLDKLRHRSSKIKLITIYNNHEEAAGDITPYVPQPLENDQIRSIIQKYPNPSDPEDDRWVELCSGSPRVAHVIGWNLQNNPGNLFNPLSTVNIWERYIASVDDPSTEQTEQHRRVLRYLALFKQFGFERPVGDEAEAIAKKIEAADPQITWTIFQEIIDNLKKRKILQGESTLAITPKALHIKLWTEWWDIYGRTFDLEEFIEGLTDKLIEWFYEMFKYADESVIASRAVKDLLGLNGPFQKGNYLQTHRGTRFFSALSEADPKSALGCLESTIGTWDRETLLHFTVGRGDIVWALQKISMHRDLFVDAARLLLALGEAKFAALFSPAPGRGAPTETSPAKRFLVLKKALKSDSKEHRALALKACNVALESRHSVRIGGAEYQGLRQKFKLWVPQTRSEFWDAYRQVWQLLSGQLTHWSEDERKKGVEVLLEHTRALGQVRLLADMVVDTIATIMKKKYVSEKRFIETINSILYYDGKKLPAKTRQRWEQLMDELVGSDFHSLMQRYVGMDLPEDLLDEDENPIDQAQPRIKELAQQAVVNHHLLQPELHWLVTTEAPNGDRFGEELGKRDDRLALLPTLLDAQRNAGENASFSFLDGYFRAILDRDPTQRKELVNVLVEDNTLKPLISWLTYSSGLTDSEGSDLLNLAQNGSIDINQFEILVSRTTIAGLSDKVFTQWIEFLLRVDDKHAVSIALYLHYRYYVVEKPELTLPPDLTFCLLTHLALFEESDQYRFNTMTDYYWTEIGKVFLNCYREKSLELVAPILSHFGETGAIVGVYSKTCSVLDEITKQHPTEVWEQVIKLLASQTRSTRVVALERWLRGRDLSDFAPMEDEDKKGTLTLIPPKEIWEWINEDVEERAWYFARNLVPKTLSAKEWPTSLARELLARYGEREEVCKCLRSNYLTEGWSGPDSLHYQEKQQKLLQIKAEEDNENVKRWIDEFVEGLKGIIEQAKIEEERIS